MATEVMALSDGGPVERMERLLQEPVEEVMGRVCQLVVEGESLRRIAKDWGVPVARFMAWVSSDDERRAAYEGALRMRADELVHESLVDASASDPAVVAGHKLKVAGLWDKRRFGRGEDGASGLKVVVMRFSEGQSPDSSSSVTLGSTLDMEK